MPKVKINGVDAVIKNMETMFKKVTTSQQMLNQIGEFTTDRMKAQIRKGKPLNNTGSFPRLKDVSVKIRKQLETLNSTHKTYKAVRSNVTFTGQLVDAIAYKIVRKSIISIDVKATTRSPINTLDGKEKKIVTNKRVQKDLKDMGFVLYTAKGIESEANITKRINNIVKKYVRRAIKVNFGS